MLLVSMKGKGLFRSTDRGKSFRPIAAGLIEANASIEYLEFSPEFGSDRSIVAASDETLFVSQDAGATWTAVSRPVRYEDMRDVVEFNGDWQRRSGAEFSAQSETVSAGSGDWVMLRFVGGGIRLLGSTGPDCGTAEVLIDGVGAGTVACRSSEAQAMQALYEFEELEPGAHTLEIRVTSGRVALDALDVLP